MVKDYTGKITLSGIAVFIIGVTLLLFTFSSSYGFLTRSLSIIASVDSTQVFGEALAPLISACIHMIYLGVMVWIGSLLTVRGITIMTHTTKWQKTPTQKQMKAQTEPPEKARPMKTQTKKLKQKTRSNKKNGKPKRKIKSPDPEIIVLPPEKATQPSKPKNQQRKNN